MFIDSRNLESGTEIQSDICIIGSGAAGITLAREFMGTSTKVVILEGGGFKEEKSSTNFFAFFI